MERDLHYYHEQSMHKDEVIDRLLSEFHTKMQPEKWILFLDIMTRQSCVFFLIS